MKIENIEKACKLNKEQKEIEEVLELKKFRGYNAIIPNFSVVPQ